MPILDSNALVVVDSNIKDYPKLVSALNSALNQRSSVAQAIDFDELQLGQVIEVAGTPVLLLDPSKEPVSQVGDYLASHHKIKYLHYFSHGQQNKLRLGDSLLSLANVGDYQQRFGRWAAGLEQQSQVLFYGCEVAKDQQGKALINRLSQYLNADVFASVDTTGAAQHQGDWELEYQSSDISEQQALQDDSSSSDRNNEVERSQVATANSLELKQYQGSLAEILVIAPAPARRCELRWHKWQPSDTAGSATLVEEDFNPIKYLAVPDGNGWWYKDDAEGSPTYNTVQNPGDVLPTGGITAPTIFFGAMLYRGTPGKIYSTNIVDSGAGDARAIRIVDGADRSVQLSRYPSADYSYYVTGNRNPAGFPQEGNAVYADGTGGTGSGRHIVPVTATIPASGLLQLEIVVTNPTLGVGRVGMSNQNCIEIDAVDDATQTVIAGFDSPLNVRDNDTLDFQSITVASVTIVSSQTVVTDTSGTVSSLLSLANNGVISVDPTAPAGTYTVAYQICANAYVANTQLLCDSASAVILVPATPAIDINKRADVSTSSVAGDQIEYIFVLTNTGNTNLNNIQIYDELLAQTFTVSDTLAPGDMTRVVASYTLTQADVDNGLTNTVTVNSTDPSGTTVSDSDTLYTTLPAQPSVNLDKQLSGDTPTQVGDIVSYNLAVTNTGNATLNSIEVYDSLLNQTLTQSGTLLPGDTIDLIVTYTITQSDVNAGGVTNTAVVSAKGPNNNTTASSDTVNILITPVTAVSIDKQASAPSTNTVGGVISYRFIVTNTGNTSLDTISVSDPKLNQTLSVPGPLAPNQTASVTATYTLTQADIDAGGVTNTAAVSAKGANGSDAQGGSDTAYSSIGASPSVSIDKQASAPSMNTVGGVISYTFTVSNTGNTSLDTISVSDPKLNQTLSVPGPLAPNQTASVTASYTLTQADVDAGGVTNTAAVSAKGANGSDAQGGSDTTYSSIGASPSVSIDKQASAPSTNTVGGVISYTFTVSNTGNTSLDTISVSDPKLNQTLSVPGPLAPNQTASVTASYTLTQADVDAGGVTNTAAVSAKGANGSDAQGGSDTAYSSIGASPSVSIDKQASAPSTNTVGGVISYTFTVSNTGNTSLDTISVSDPKLNQTLSVPGPLAPNQTASVTASYTLTQADIDAGGVTNTAAVSAKGANGSDAQGGSDTAYTSIGASPSVSIDKQASAPSTNTVGGVISYTFTVSNTGNTSLDTISVSDPKLNQTLSVPGPLAPNQTVSVTATYTLTQADVDAGGVTNTAAVSAKGANGSDAQGGSDTAYTSIGASPSVSIDKQASAPSTNTVGGVISYTFTVSNTGNTSLDTISVSDPKLNQTLSVPGPLAPNQTASVTASYTLTQADIDAGGVTNTAAVSAKGANGSDAQGGSDTAYSSIGASPSVSIDKQASAPSTNTVGGVISYTFTVSNTGNTSLDTISVSDPKLNQTLSVPGPLAPNQTASVTASYTLTQADIDAGGVTNTAAVSAKGANGSDAQGGSDTAYSSIGASPSVSIDKQASAPSMNTVGGVISYTFTVSNTGNTSLDTISVSDPKLNQTLSVPGPLAPNQTASVTASYTLTQADVDAGGVTNTAAVSAKGANGSDAQGGSDTTYSSIGASPSVSIDKQASAPSTNTVGGVISYRFIVTNTGNTSLDTISVSDPKLNQTLSVPGPLAPNQTASVTASYTLTQADVDAGGVTNTAAVSAKGANGSDAQGGSDTAYTSIGASPSVSIDKQASAPSTNTVGGVISYRFIVTNTGNTSLDTISVSDPKLNQTLSVPGPLAPNQTASVTASYTLTQADVDAGGVTNTAAVSAKGANGSDAQGGSDTTYSSIGASPSVSIDKQASAPSTNTVGGVISYRFIVTNTGNTSLDTISVSDPKLNQTLSVPGPLAPNQTASVTASYTLTQADVDAGGVTNTAAVSAKGANGSDAQGGSDTAYSSIGASPSVSIDKQASAPSTNTVGGVISYTFTVSNTGNTSLDTISVSDPKLNQTLSVPGPLAPNQTASVTASYTLTQADIDAGGVTNTAAVSAKGANGSDAQGGSDTAYTSIGASPSVSIDKQASAPSTNTVGGVISYRFIVTNTGNTSLDTISVSDPKLNQTLSVPGPLAPGATASVTASYTLTQADIDAGGVTNTAAVSAKGANGSDAQGGSDTAYTSIGASPSVNIDKQASAPSTNTVGGVISYRFIVTNTGNTSLDTISVSDPKLNQTLSVPGPLAPNQTASVTASYTLTQADVDAGGVTNTAAVSAKGANGSDAQGGSDTAYTSIGASPSVSIDKQASAPSTNTVGGVISYRFIVTNTGNTSLDTISVSDPKLNQTLSVPGPLAPNQTVSVTASYTLTQADVDAGGVTNTAAVSAKGANGSDAQGGSDTTYSSIGASPSVSIDKQASAPSTNTVGGVISYRFIVTNTGNTSLDTISVSDPKLNQTLSVPGPLAPNQTASVTASYTLTQADVDAGGVTNTAAVSAKGANGSDAQGGSDTTYSSIGASPSVSIDKQASAPSTNTVGGVISYRFIVTNTGNTSLDTISVSDPKLNQTLSVPGPLAPNQTASVTASYTLTQADIDAGGVTNTAAVSAKGANGSDAQGGSDTTYTSIGASPSVSIDKQASAPSTNTVGGVISYTFTVSNTGNTSLDTISVSDPKLNQTLSVPGPLAPNQTVSVTASYTLTQADVDAGGVTNTAAVSAKGANGSDAQGGSDTTYSSIGASPSVSIDKQASAPSTNTVGGVISYRFIVTNTGNTSLDTISVSDPKLNQTLSVPGPLAPNQTASVTASYTLTQADIDAGGVTNTAAVSAKGANGSDAQGGSDTAYSSIGASPSVSIDKQASAPSMNTVGGVISYTFTVSNTGNTSLDTISVSDPKLNQTLSVPGPLAPNQTASVTASYTLTQADVDAGGVTNTAAVSAKGANGSDAQGGSDTTYTSIGASPSLTIIKAGAAPQTPTVGALISYTFTVTNTGNVMLQSITINDPLLDQAASCNPTQLNVSQTATCTGTHALTQQDLNASEVLNTATVSAQTPAGSSITSSVASATVSFDVASIGGVIWLDEDGNNTLTVGSEKGLAGYQLSLYEGAGSIDSSIRDVISDSEGRYHFGALPPNTTYTVVVRDANGNFVNQTVISASDIPVGKVIELPLPIDPSGVVYDSITRLPVAGATVRLIDTATGNEIDPNCLGVNKSGQVTGADGKYEFLLQLGLPGCAQTSGLYRIEIDPPSGYEFESENIPATAGTVTMSTSGCLVSGSNVDAVPATASTCEIQVQADAPSTSTTATPYYLGFNVQSGAVDVIHNHIPLDPERPVANPDTYTIVAGDSFTASVVVNDLLNPFRSTYTISFDTSTINDPNNGLLSLNDQGELSYTAPAGTDGTVSFEYALTHGDGKVSTTTVTIYVNNPSPTQYDLDKRVNKDDVSIGDVVRYSLVIKARGDDTQTGTVTLRDVMPAGIDLVKDTIRFVRVTAAGQRTAAEERVNEAGVDETRRIELSWQARTGDAYEVSYFGRIGAGASFGKRVNRAQLFGANGAAVSNVGEAAVRIGEDPILDKLTVIGKVFNDVNRNGIQDEELGELGLAGVRVISLSGQIITTDEYGRFHVPAVSAGSRDNGRNYLLKVDAASLPDGYEFSTENPRVLRITPGLLTRMNFGVYKPLEVDPVYEECTQTAIKRSIDESIAPVYFESGKNVISVATMNKLKALVSRYKAKERLHFTLEGRTDIERLAPKLRRKYASNKALALARAQVVASQLAQALGLSADQLTITATTTTKATASRDKSRDRRTDISVSYMDMSTSTEQCRALGAGAVQPNGAGSDIKKRQQASYL